MVTASPVQLCFFLTGAENLKLFWKNSAEEQPLCSMLFFSGRDICKDFPASEDPGENPADAGIIVTDLFI